MVKVKFFDPEFVPEGKLTYSVIAASRKGEWLFVKHRLRNTWEIPGGHIEEGESPYDAACRELGEETGALDFDLDCVATYSVEKEGQTGYGRLYYAEVKRSGSLKDDSEIAEVMSSGHLPNDLTYPDIQPELFLKVLDFLAGNK